MLQSVSAFVSAKLERRSFSPSNVPSSATNGKEKNNVVELAMPTGVNAPKDKSSGSSGLAARRKLYGLPGGSLQVKTTREGPIEKGERVPDGQKKQTIIKTDRFASLYTIGREVMPSTNTGMEVRYAQRVKDGASVVIKVRIKSESFVNKDEENEWRSSTEMILNLPKSENIAQLHEVVEDAHAYYVVMEKVEGSDLFEMLASEGRISMAESRAILRKLLQAVQALHAKGCIHKDLKLECNGRQGARKRLAEKHKVKVGEASFSARRHSRGITRAYSEADRFRHC
jgi:hypothetical protein